jgi:DNA-binding CsgD family transcriptional regulator
VLAELAVRRGDADAEQRLADLDDRASRAADAEWLVPVVELSNELALTGDRPPPTERLRALVADPDVHGQLAIRIAAAAALAGLGFTDVEGDRSPHRLVAAGDWRAAADAFGESGWPYDRALMLSLLDDAPSLEEALSTARSLGAVPLEQRVARRLRELGHRVPRGPYGTTRSNPAHLTQRQLEVLALLVDGRTNQEIADELVVSLRTAEHHVAAVLAKLGATSRREAPQRAVDLGLLVPDR